MKYGLLVHKPTTNVGDDIQSYACAQFFPHIDYILDRENLDKFQSDNNEPVAAIMAAWWMWQKWNWPPAECIIPKFISMHFNNYTVREKASPILDEWLQGIGKQYFDSYGPIGVRDQTSLDFLKERGLDAYLSGCITLTLPKQKETKDKGKYVVIADLRPQLKKCVKEWLKDSGLEIREVTHNCNYRFDNETTIEERLKKAEDILTLYQNAKFVITRRLHVTLPCLAMEVPVMSIVNLKVKGNKTRWAPYHTWVNYFSEEDIISGNFDYDYNNPPENKQDYLPVRNALIDNINSFINEMEQYGDAPLEQIKKTPYTEAEARAWQFDLMRNTLDRWLHLNRGILSDLDKAKKRAKELEKGNGKRISNEDSIFNKAKRKIKRILKK